MNDGVEAVLYDGVSSRPIAARVRVDGPNALVVEHGAERYSWPLEDKGLAYYDDFFELSGNWPDWVTLHAMAARRGGRRPGAKPRRGRPT